MSLTNEAAHAVSSAGRRAASGILADGSDRVVPAALSLVDSLEIESVGSLGLSSRALHSPSAGAIQGLIDVTSGEVNLSSITRALRESGTVEGAAVAKMLKRGIIKIKLSEVTLPIPRGGEMPFGSNEMILYRRYAGSPQQAAGLAAHEAEHFLQKLTLASYARGDLALQSELAAYSVQRRIDPTYFLGTDDKAIRFLVDSPVYPHITQRVADAFLESGIGYTTSLR